MKAHSAIFESESVFKNLFFKLEFESNDICKQYSKS